MIFTETDIPGSYVIELEKHRDERGFFGRAWCATELEAQGLNPRLVQVNLSGSERAGTLRGMHYQRPPHEEAKCVRCTRGAIYDVVLDLRPDSPTYTRWAAVELSAQDGRALYVPEGCAHGFQTLADDTEVLYFVSEFYAPESEGGVRWDDPAFSIAWPQRPTVLSPRDAAFPDFRREDVGA